MEIGAFLKAISQVNSTWSVAAFSIAALLAVLRLKAASLGNSIVWGIVVAICFLGGLPIIARTYLDHERNTTITVYRVRTLALSPDGIPTPGASFRTAVPNETTTTSDGTGEVAIYRQSMPADGKVTIYADYEDPNSERWHGHSEIQLGKDPNPSVTIYLVPEERATVTGFVEDDSQHAVPGATVSIVGGGSTRTGPDGKFTLNTNAAAGQQVVIHVEKLGYVAVDQNHPAGRNPVTVTIDHAPPKGGHPKQK
jgi:hypothetical protein